MTKTADERVLTGLREIEATARGGRNLFRDAAAIMVRI